jgi:hypothetical protein
VATFSGPVWEEPALLVGGGNGRGVFVAPFGEIILKLFAEGIVASGVGVAEKQCCGVVVSHERILFLGVLLLRDFRCQFRRRGDRVVELSPVAFPRSFPKLPIVH